jgi:hypothetical protein
VGVGLPVQAAPDVRGRCKGPVSCLPRVAMPPLFPIGVSATGLEPVLAILGAHPPLAQRPHRRTRPNIIRLKPLSRSLRRIIRFSGRALPHSAAVVSGGHAYTPGVQAVYDRRTSSWYKLCGVRSTAQLTPLRSQYR